jgi:hypothetical protein
LVAKKLIVRHAEVDPPSPPSPEHHRTLLPDQIPFISYPYEWCFSQLKDAALLTLRLQRLAMKHEMSLKDASSYNIQFVGGRPIMIDTLSFERYREGSPWVGYRQFCQHFLAPLALMCKRDIRLLEMMRVHIDGIPLDLATSLLPTRSFLNRALYLHLRLHARYQRNYDDTAAGTGVGDADSEAKAPKARTLSKQAVANLVEDLRTAVRKLDWTPKGTEWAEYYSGDSYEDGALEHKKTLVRDHLEALAPACVWDLGANTGVYSRIAAETCPNVVSFDIDPACVERNYREVKQKKEERILPQLLDLVNPSPALGWAHDERSSLAQRAQADAILALALIHHIAISNNVPLSMVAAYFAELSPNLIIEFVPKSDPKVKTLLATREDIFPSYTREGFEAAFRQNFEILAADDIQGSDRTLYRMARLP